MPIQAVVNPLYPNRIQLVLGVEAGDLVGPFIQPNAAPFDPTVDLQLYIGGVQIPIQTWSFDASNNQYLLYTYSNFDFSSAVVQVIFHMPLPPFMGMVNDYLVQEDGTSLFLLENGVDVILLET